MRYLWVRRSADSNHNFDLVLQNPKDLDVARMHELLGRITQEKHRKQTLRGSAVKEFQRFFDHPDTPLKSAAYALLSNWFMTRSGDRNSMVASRCEAMWDELFPCRPLARLTSPAPQKNHIVLASEFQSFWSLLSKAQSEGGDPSEPRGLPSFPTGSVPDDAPQDAARLTADTGLEFSSGLKADVRVSATFMKDGLQFQVEGAPGAMADFLDHWLKKTDN